MKNKNPLVVSAVILCFIALAVFFTTRPDKAIPPSSSGQQKDTASSSGDAGAALSGSSPANGNTSTSPSKEGGAGVTTRTKVRDRGAAVDRTRLPVVDLSKSLAETPPWPDGPKLHAEVATETKRFVNLRPNNIGIMPTVNLGTTETVSISLEFPENSEGDKIFVELVDGGFFLDTEKPGQVLTLGKNRKLEIPLSSDERVGHCKLFIRQSGHTRVLPLWVGPPMPLAAAQKQ